LGRLLLRRKIPGSSLASPLYRRPRFSAPRRHEKTTIDITSCDITT